VHVVISHRRAVSLNGAEPGLEVQVRVLVTGSSKPAGTGPGCGGGPAAGARALRGVWRML